MEKEIRAFVPTHICVTLQHGKEGEILLVTSSGIYLRIGEEIMLLCDGSWGILPIGIGLENFDVALSALQPRQGETVRVEEERLEFIGGTIRLMLQPEPDKVPHQGAAQRSRILQAAKELAAMKKERGISMLVQPLILGQPLAENLKTNPYCMYAYPYFSKLVAAFDEKDDVEIGNCIKKLLGLGPGLTPSADDVLLGMLYVFRMLPGKCPNAALAFQESITRLCKQYTNQISGAYLKSIIDGAPFERMESLYRGLCGEKSLDIQQLVQIGSSSGSEMLLGMLIALRICGYDLTREELK